MQMNLPDLRLVQERFWNAVKNEKEYIENKIEYPDFTFYLFPQTWGSTALGFNGAGGQAITSAYTVVGVDQFTSYVAVFFGERVGYIINNPNQELYEDMRKMRMEPCAMKGKYINPNQVSHPY